MLRRLFGGKPKPTGTLVVARINARVQPLDRGEIYEDPLQELLSKEGLGEVTGGGSELSELGEIEYCDIEMVLPETTPEKLRLVVGKLESLGAPKGSQLTTEPAMPFGVNEGLAVYLNGTDLPDETYRDCDSNVVVTEFNRLLAGSGRVQSNWQGPTETALYIYGKSAADMRARIQPFLDSYPLCARARVVQIV